MLFAYRRMLLGLRIWNLCLMFTGVYITVTTCAPVKLYGCSLPDDPSPRLIFLFQKCVAKVNRITNGYGGRWGRSIRSNTHYRHTGDVMLNAIQNTNTEGNHEIQIGGNKIICKSEGKTTESRLLVLITTIKWLCHILSAVTVIATKLLEVIALTRRDN